MERWAGKTAVVTGASAGIGAAIVIDLANAGMNVVALARRKERLDELKSKLARNCPGSIHPLRCDVTDENDVRNAFAWVEKHMSGVDVLVNNAGVIRSAKLVDRDNSKAIHDIVNTNILGVVYCTREAFQSMKARDMNGHIININSIAGHKVPFVPELMATINIYPASKHAVTALTETLRLELQTENTKIKVTVCINLFSNKKSARFSSLITLFPQSISPGAVKTEIFLPEQVEALKQHSIPMLESEDVSQAVLYAIATPAHVQVKNFHINVYFISKIY